MTKPNPLRETSLLVSGMTCGHCVQHVQQALTSLDGVLRADVDLAQQRARVQHDPGRAPITALIAAIVEQGYEASPA